MTAPDLGTPLYQRVIAHDYGDAERTLLMRQVWTATPWMVDAYTGGYARDREREDRIREWCAETFGPEAFVLGGRPGNWQRGSATIDGWTWMGFVAYDMLMQFVEYMTPEHINLESLR